MLTFLTTFSEELFLISYILGGLLFCSAVQYDKKQAIDKKRYFLLFCRITLIFLTLFFLYSSGQLIHSLVSTEPASLFLSFFDSISSNLLYYYKGQQPFATAFFRKDLVTLFFLWCLTGLVVFYFYCYYTIQTTTNNQSHYFLEVPILIITIFFSLRVFLYTYDLILIVLALELTSFCTLVLISLPATTKQVTNIFPLEAAIKYFIFNALAISLFLFAICSYYSLTKSLNLFDFSLFVLFEPSFYFERLEILLLTHFLFFSAYLIKLGVAPYHNWVPDVYEGAELLITAFLVLVIGPTLNFKLFIFIKMLLPLTPTSLLFALFLGVGFLSIIIGTFYAFLQVKIKRFLAYTGITHLGYILLSFGTGTTLGIFASFFYLVSYILTNCVFFSLLLLTRRFAGTSLLYLNQLKILFTESSLILLFFSIPLFSFAGFPPFMGFFSKLFTLFTLVDQKYYFLVLLLIGYIVISAYLYLRFFKIGLFEQTKIQTYLPLQSLGLLLYYKLSTNVLPLKQKRIVFSQVTTLLFLLFCFNGFLLAFLGFLPVFCLLLQQPLVMLLLIY